MVMKCASCRRMYRYFTALGEEEVCGYDLGGSRKRIESLSYVRRRRGPEVVFAQFLK